MEIFWAILWTFGITVVLVLVGVAVVLHKLTDGEIWGALIEGSRGQKDRSSGDEAYDSGYGTPQSVDEDPAATYDPIRQPSTKRDPLWP